MRIGFVSFGSDGDIQPHIDLALTLAKRDHVIQLAVISLTNKDYTYLNEVKGITIYQSPFPHEKMEEKFTSKAFWEFDKDQLKSYFDSQFTLIRGHLRRHAKKIAKSSDIVIGARQIFALRFNAEVYNIPFITITPEHIFLKSKYYGPPGEIDNSYEENLEGWRETEDFANKYMLPYLNHIRKMNYNLPPVEDYYKDILYSDKLNLVRYSKHLFPGELDWEPQHHVCGYFKPMVKNTNWEMPSTLNKFIENGHPPILISMGSLIEYEEDVNVLHQILIDAVKKANCRAIIRSKWGKEMEHTDQVYFLEGFVDYASLMPRCQLVVHHGGSGVSHDTAANGVPSLIIAYGFDQFDNARLLKQVGICSMSISRKELDVTKLADAIVDSLNDSSIAKKAKEISLKMKNEDGLNEAIRIIEEKFGNSPSFS